MKKLKVIGLAVLIASILFGMAGCGNTTGGGGAGGGNGGGGNGGNGGSESGVITEAERDVLYDAIFAAADITELKDVIRNETVIGDNVDKIEWSSEKYTDPIDKTDCLLSDRRKAFNIIYALADSNAGMQITALLDVKNKDELKTLVIQNSNGQITEKIWEQQYKNKKLEELKFEFIDYIIYQTAPDISLSKGSNGIIVNLGKTKPTVANGLRIEVMNIGTVGSHYYIVSEPKDSVQIPFVVANEKHQFRVIWEKDSVGMMSYTDSITPSSGLGMLKIENDVSLYASSSGESIIISLSEKPTFSPSASATNHKYVYKLYDLYAVADVKLGDDGTLSGLLLPGYLDDKECLLKYEQPSENFADSPSINITEVCSSKGVTYPANGLVHVNACFSSGGLEYEFHIGNYGWVETK